VDEHVVSMVENRWTGEVLGVGNLKEGDHIVDQAWMGEW